MWKRIKHYWRVFNRPAAYISLGTLSMGGFIAGIIFWGGFNTALEYTNTEQFCISCHEMKANPYKELIPTIHYTNRSGVRAVCSDCHVPHDWTFKIARKMEASKEVWGWIFGTIDTEEEFKAKRRMLAEREWRRLKANDSLECRNCHDFDYMDFTLQSPRARAMHSTLLASGEKTCIDCHKGIAHQLPDMQSVPLGQHGQAMEPWQMYVTHLDEPFDNPVQAP